MSEALKSVTLKSLVQSGVITAISPLRVNTSGYPYITFLQGNKPNNVYFSKKASLVINGTFEKGDNIVTFLKNAEIVQTEVTEENGDVRVRFKISTPGASEYSSTAELMDVFGMSEKTTEFDMELFKKEFTSQTAVVPAESTEA